MSERSGAAPPAGVEPERRPPLLPFLVLVAAVTLIVLSLVDRWCPWR